VVGRLALHCCCCCKSVCDSKDCCWVDLEDWLTGCIWWSCSATVPGGILSISSTIFINSPPSLTGCKQNFIVFVYNYIYMCVSVFVSN
jgi:hypothetical protein